MRSPLDGADGPITVEIKTNGTEVPDTTELLSVHIEAETGARAKATLLLADGDLATGTFPDTDGPNFLPGANVDVALGYGAKNKAVFEGTILSQRQMISRASGGQLELACEGVLAGSSEGLWMTMGEEIIEIDAITADNGIEGWVSCPGVVQALDTELAIKEVGERFSGLYQVTGVRHHVEAGDWTTWLRFVTKQA